MSVFVVSIEEWVRGYSNLQLASLKPQDKFMRVNEIAMRLDPTYLLGGPPRALGRFLMKLPRFFGKVRSRSGFAAALVSCRW